MGLISGPFFLTSLKLIKYNQKENSTSFIESILKKKCQMPKNSLFWYYPIK